MSPSSFSCASSFSSSSPRRRRLLPSSSSLSLLLFLSLLSCLCLCWLPAGASAQCTATWLNDSLPVTGQVVQDGYTYYGFQVPLDEPCGSQCILTVILTNLENDADLYASGPLTDSQVPNPYPCPSWDEVEFWSESVGGDSLVLSTAPGDYWLVFAGGYPNADLTLMSSYSIVLDVTARGSQRIFPIANGQSMYGAVTAAQSYNFDSYGGYDTSLVYYSIVIPPPAAVSDSVALTVTLNPLVGNPYLFVGPADEIPTAENFIASTVSSVNNIVTVNVGVGLQTVTTYYFAVWSYDVSGFLITASYSVANSTGGSVSFTMQRLSSGIAFAGLLTSATDVAYYSFNATGVNAPVNIYLDVISVSERQTRAACPCLCMRAALLLTLIAAVSALSQRRRRRLVCHHLPAGRSGAQPQQQGVAGSELR